MELASGDARQTAGTAARAIGFELAASKEPAGCNPLLPQRRAAKQRSDAIVASRSIRRRFCNMRGAYYSRCKQGPTERRTQRWLAGTRYREHRNAQDLHQAGERRDGTLPEVAGPALLRNGKRPACVVVRRRYAGYTLCV